MARAADIFDVASDEDDGEPSDFFEQSSYVGSEGGARGEQSSHYTDIENLDDGVTERVYVDHNGFAKTSSPALVEPSSWLPRPPIACPSRR